MPPALQNPVTLWLLLTAALAGLVYAFMRPELRWKAIGYGAFLNTVIDFLIVALVVFLLVKQVNRMMKPQPAPAPPPTKQCPYCMSEGIATQATRCPHCTAELKAA